MKDPLSNLVNVVLANIVATTPFQKQEVELQTTSPDALENDNSFNGGQLKGN